MRTLGYFGLVLSVMYMLSCSGDSKGAKSSDNVSTSGKATAADTCAGIGNPGSTNNFSNDVVQNRIVNRKFRVMGEGEEVIDRDECKPSLKGHSIPFKLFIDTQDPQQGPNQPVPPAYGNGSPYINPAYPSSQFAGYNYPRHEEHMPRVGNQGIEFKFDACGVLTVKVINAGGEQVSGPVSPITVNDGTTAVNQMPDNTYAVDTSNPMNPRFLLGRVVTSGHPSIHFVHRQLRDEGVYSEQESQGPNFIPTSNDGRPFPGMRSDFQPGQDPFAPKTVAKVQDNISESGLITVLSGLEGYIVMPSGDPQHIEAIKSHQLVLHYEIHSKDSSLSNRSCLQYTTGQTGELLIQ